MQGPDIAAVSLEKASVMFLEKPWTYAGLSVQGVSPYRLTPIANPEISLTPEFRAQLARKNLVRLLIEPRTVIALVGHGLQPVALTVRAHVRAMLTMGGLVRMVANMQNRATSIPKPAHRSEVEVEFDEHAQTSTNEEHVARVRADMARGLEYMGVKLPADTEVEL